MKKSKLNKQPKRVCYGLIDVEMADDSITLVRPILITEGEKGYHRTDWAWRKPNARAALNKTNAQFGFTPEVADKWMCYSMFGWPKSLPAYASPSPLPLLPPVKNSPQSPPIAP